MQRVAAVVLLVVGTAVTLAQDKITQADLLRRMIDVDRLMHPPAGERTQTIVASVPEERGNEWRLLAELKGPAALTRICVSEPAGEIRFVLDGAEVLSTAMPALFAGEVAPFMPPLISGGCTSYLPIGFAQSCRVESRAFAGACEVDLVEFPPDAGVQRFSLQLDDDARVALAEVRRTLIHGFAEDQWLRRRNLPIAVQQELITGDVLRESFEGAGVIRALHVAVTDKIDPRDLYALHNCILRVFFDGQPQPAVEAPLVDFFGSGFDLTPYDSLMMGTDLRLQLPLPDRRASLRRFMYCRYPMPFASGFRLEIENLHESRKSIGLLVHMAVELRDAIETPLRFHAQYRRVAGWTGDPVRVLETAGPGRIVGCTLNLDGPCQELWSTLHVRAVTDAARASEAPWSSCATWMGAGPAPRGFTDAFYGATRVTGFGKSSLFRWRLGDCISFERSATVEFQCDATRDTYLGALLYWYGLPDAARVNDRLAASDLALPGLRIPHAVEIEDLLVGAGWGNWLDQKQAGNVELSGRMAVVITTEQPVELRIPSSSARTVTLMVRVHPGRTFESIAFHSESGELIGEVPYQRRRDGIHHVGRLKLAEGTTTITVTCKRAAVLDCLILEPAD